MKKFVNVDKLKMFSNLVRDVKQANRTIYLIVAEIVQITLFIVAIYFMSQVATGSIKININVEKTTKEK